VGRKPALTSRVLSIQSGFLIAVWIAYLLLFFPLYKWLGSFATILAVIPVILSSWRLGFWTGALIGLMAFVLDAFLLFWVRSPDLRVLLGVPGVPIAIVMIAVGAAVGRLSDVSGQLERQLAERKRVEGALREAEAKYRTLVEQVPAAIYMDAPDEVSSTIYFSPQIEAISGYSPDEWLANPKLWVKLLHPDDRQRMLAESARTNATGESFKVEYRLVGRGGQTVWVRDEAVLVRDAAGRPQYWQGILFDITDRKRAEVVLRESEARQALILRSLPMAFYTARTSGDFGSTWIGDNAEQVTGFSPRLFIEDPSFWAARLYPADRERALKEAEALLATGSQRLEYRWQHADGTYHWFLDVAVIVRDETGKPRQIIGAWLDITDRKRAEETLRRQNEYLSALHETALGLMNRLELKDVLENIVTRTAQLLGTPNGCIYLAEPGETELKWKVSVGKSSAVPFDFINPGEGLTGEIWRTGQPLVVDDYDTWPDRVPYAPPGEIRAVMGAPLKSGDQVIGVIILAHDEPGFRFEKDDVELLGRFAQLALIALDNARLYRAEREQRELAETLHKIGATLVSTLDLEIVLDRILEQVSRVVPNDAADVMLVQDSQAVVVRWRGYERFGVAPEQVFFSIAGTASLRQMFETGEPVVIPDVQADPDWVSISQSEWIRSFASAPIRARDNVIGFLNVNSATPCFFEPVHVERLHVFAHQAAIALVNARLFSEAQKSAQHMEALFEASRTLSSSLEEEPLLRAMLEAAYRTLGYEYAAISTVDEAARRVGVRHGIWGGQFDLFPEWIRMAQYSLDESDILADVCRTGRTEIVGEWDDRFNREIWDRFGHERLLRIFVPIKIRDRVIGVIEAGYDKQIKSHIGEEEVLVLAAFADQVAAALENARLYRVEREQLRRLQDSQAQLVRAEKMAALGRLIGSISHEINNPLQAIQGSLTLIEEEVAGARRPEKLKRYVDIAEQSSERIANMVRRVRDFYRPTSHAMRPTDVRAVLQAVLELADNQLTRGNVAVEQEQVGDLPLVQANADELQQVLLNLVLNAVDAMADPAAARGRGGTLRLRVERDQMQIRDGSTRPAVRIDVSDTGDGIPPGLLPHIFEPFTTTHPDKTALGLSISYAIIEAHGGQMSVTSRLGVGTTFTILLPVETTNDE
jgi:PAS domain S-box-containing protein